MLLFQARNKMGATVPPSITTCFLPTELQKKKLRPKNNQLFGRRFKF